MKPQIILYHTLVPVRLVTSSKRQFTGSLTGRLTGSLTGRLTDSLSGSITGRLTDSLKW